MVLEEFPSTTEMFWWAVVILALWAVSIFVINFVDDCVKARRRARAAEVEALLDRKQSELREAVLRLADALAEERVEANRASEEMIRSAYLTRGELPRR